MVDNHGIQGVGIGQSLLPGQSLRPGQAAGEGQDFKSLLEQSLQEVNRLQAQAEEATVNLATGKTENVADVFTTVKKAELAFQTLLQIRNKLMDAYDEIKQIRV